MLEPPESHRHQSVTARWIGQSAGIVANGKSPQRLPMGTRDDINGGGIVYSPIEISGNPRVLRYAKTLYKPTPPKDWEDRINALTKSRLPRFFIYAKDKTPHQCEPANDSTVNRLFDKVQSYKFDFNKKQLGSFDYHKLMHDPDIELGPEQHLLIRNYEDIVRKIGDRNIGIGDEKDRYVEAIKMLRRELSVYGSDQYITDVLVAHLFGVKKSNHKAALWDAYGEVMYQNLLDNKAGAQKMCSKCGKRFTPLYPHHCLCDECSAGMKKSFDKAEAEIEMDLPDTPPEAFCIDCGRTFTPASLRQTRCPVCQWLAENEMVIAAPGENVERCTICGAAFATRARGRGKRRKVCDRCRDEAKRDKIRDRVRRHRERNMLN